MRGLIRRCVEVLSATIKHDWHRQIRETGISLAQARRRAFSHQDRPLLVTHNHTSYVEHGKQHPGYTHLVGSILREREVHISDLEEADSVVFGEADRPECHRFYPNALNAESVEGRSRVRIEGAYDFTVDLCLVGVNIKAPIQKKNDAIYIYIYIENSYNPWL